MIHNFIFIGLLYLDAANLDLKFTFINFRNIILIDFFVQ